MRLIAYRTTSSGPAPRIAPAGRERGWATATPGGFARRCLPMMMASQAGWELLSPAQVIASWNGGPALADLAVAGPAASHFGGGVLTWQVPYLFRTPAGFDLLVRGPANEPKDGVAPLEGLVETDWAVATFTMNWRMTRPGTVSFAEGEPFALLVPQRRADLAAFEPRIEEMSPEDARAHGKWLASRTAFNARVGRKLSEWQGHYMRGTDVDGAPAPEHRTREGLAPFAVPETDEGAR